MKSKPDNFEVDFLFLLYFILLLWICSGCSYLVQLWSIKVNQRLLEATVVDIIIAVVDDVADVVLIVVADHFVSKCGQ